MKTVHTHTHTHTHTHGYMLEYYSVLSLDEDSTHTHTHTHTHTYICWNIIQPLKKEILKKKKDPTICDNNFHWKDWSWSWNFNTLTIWYEELTHWNRPWCWERLKAGEGDDRGWDGWMTSTTQWTWVWINSGSWWWTGRPAMLQSMGLQRVGHDWATELTDWMS